MEIQESRQGAVTCVKPMGPLVQGDAAQFHRATSEVRSRSLGRFVVDLAAVPYADSLGLEALVELTDELGEGGQSLRICGANETLREVLSLTGVADLFEHYIDVNTAVRSFL